MMSMKSCANCCYAYAQIKQTPGRLKGDIIFVKFSRRIAIQIILHKLKRLLFYSRDAVIVIV